MNSVSIPETVVQAEFDRSTERFNVITSWVGLSLNLLWTASDYFIFPQFLLPFFIFRLCVSATGAFCLVFRKKLPLSIYHCMFILVLGISLQNAYMWSMMDVQHFQQHAFAYIVLFIGVGMLVLWETHLSVLLLVFNVAANIVFRYLNSELTVQEYMVNGGLITLTVMIFCIFQIRTRHRLILNDIRIRLELEKSKRVIEQKHQEVVAQKVEIQEQKEKVEEQNREITDSIRYAGSIQNALIPSEAAFRAHFRDSFVLFRPKDIVSGDFFWVHEREDHIFYVTADCTGHGVPGGFMTMLGLSQFDEIIKGRKTDDPAEMLNMMRGKIMDTLNQKGTVGENKDGMDAIICRISKKTRELAYAAANNDFYIIRTREDGTKEMITCKADRQPCGYYHLNEPFTSHIMALSEGDCIYTFSDGYADQFGGPRGKKFRYSQLEDTLKFNSHLPFETQKKILADTLDAWKGDLDQVDDILLIGVKI